MVERCVYAFGGDLSRRSDAQDRVCGNGHARPVRRAGAPAEVRLCLLRSDKIRARRRHRPACRRMREERHSAAAAASTGLGTGSVCGHEPGTGACASRLGLPDQEFAEPVTLSSTSPTDVPLGVSRRIRSAYGRPVRLRSTRAPCSAQARHYGAARGHARPRAKKPFAICVNPEKTNGSGSGLHGQLDCPPRARAVASARSAHGSRLLCARRC